MKNHIFSEAVQSFQEKVRNAIGQKVALGTALALFMLGGLAGAQSTSVEFVPFGSFIDQTAKADANDYMARPASKVQDAASFEEMRQHILNMYEGVDVNHSFVLGSAHYDCIPAMQQPAVRKYGLTTIAAPPTTAALAEPVYGGDDANAPKRAALPDEVNAFDAFGNSTHCEEHTVAIRRVTLETTSRFPSLKQFFQKSENEHIPTHQEYYTPGGTSHKYSTAFQDVDNYGGNSVLNDWMPYVDLNAGEVFSLSQAWYTGGINSGKPPCGGSESCTIQTEEVGWVVYEAMFGDPYTHFFIFSTPDGYNSGCWNNGCGDFVVCDGCDGGVIGAQLSPTSITGGAQYESEVRYFFSGGNWWVQFESNWVGYYPGSMYNGGQNTKHAQEIAFGTETVGTTKWPAAGAGQWLSKGYGYAAYQSYLFYYNTKSAAIWDSLTPDISSPKCYNILGPYYGGSGEWNDYFYDGGPGGTGC
jgi:hypothetical protein